MTTLTQLQARLASLQAEINNTHRPDDIRPTKHQMARYNAKLDSLTTEVRETKGAIEKLTQPEVRVFVNDIENARSAERWAIMQKRQIAGLTGR